MTLDTIRDAIPDYARDLKLNLGSVLSTTGAPGLTLPQAWSVALACALAARTRASPATWKRPRASNWMLRIARPRARPLPSWA